MRILLSNDDGYFAPGVDCLAQHLSEIANVTVVAPERDYSGASNSLTLNRPLSLKQASNGYYYVNGTPTDCVYLAVTEVMKELPDMVISGVNQGANMGDDTLYSGTVAAATEGFLLGIPSIAVSLCSASGKNFDTAAKITLELVQILLTQDIQEALLLNVNVPDAPYEELRGMAVTRLGKRHKAKSAVRYKTPRNETVYWIGVSGEAKDKAEGTDFYAVDHNQVSITPLQVDMTHNAQLSLIQSWLG